MGVHGGMSNLTTGAAICVPPRPGYCPEKNRQLKEYTRAVSDFLRMESAKVAALVRSDQLAFDAEFGEARKRKDAAKEAIRKQQQEHGC